MPTDVEPIIGEVLTKIAQSSCLKQNRWMMQTLADSPIFEEFSKKDRKELENSLKNNQDKQLKLTDAYLDNLLGGEVYKAKIESLRDYENQLRKLIAAERVRENLRRQTQEYKHRVHTFLDRFNPARKELDIYTKKTLLSLIFISIEVFPAYGGARPKKRISYSLYEPFNTILLEERKKCQHTKNKRIATTDPEKSILKPTADRMCKFRTMILKVLKMLTDCE